MDYDVVIVGGGTYNEKVSAAVIEGRITGSRLQLQTVMQYIFEEDGSEVFV